jgi:hypothetical protein
MRGAKPPLPQYAFKACCSVKEAQAQLYLYQTITNMATVRNFKVISGKSNVAKTNGNNEQKTI